MGHQNENADEAVANCMVWDGLVWGYLKLYAVEAVANFMAWDGF